MTASMYEMIPFSLAVAIARTRSSLLPHLVPTDPFWSNSPRSQMS